MNASRFMHQGAEERQRPSLWESADDVVIVDEKGTIVVCERSLANTGRVPAEPQVKEGNTRKEICSMKKRKEEKKKKKKKRERERESIFGVRESRTTKRVMRVNCDPRAQELNVRGSYSQEITTANGWYSLDRMGGRVVM
ncbi:hypothetical protein LB504_000563 [Fusarium proliferatum]|nr:hypothetical protein LB504_000563 [Fusarium proliferatum]